LPQNCFLIGVGRTPMEDKAFRDYLKDSLKRKNGKNLSQKSFFTPEGMTILKVLLPLKKRSWDWKKTSVWNLNASSIFQPHQMFLSLF
jgi:hypothetical protein